MGGRSTRRHGSKLVADRAKAGTSPTWSLSSIVGISGPEGQHPADAPKHHRAIRDDHGEKRVAMPECRQIETILELTVW
jgi:hypothetical protein